MNERKAKGKKKKTNRQLAHSPKVLPCSPESTKEGGNLIECTGVELPEEEEPLEGPGRLTLEGICNLKGNVKVP